MARSANMVPPYCFYMEQDAAAAKQYIYDNLQLATFRRMALEELIAEKNYEKAAKIAQKEWKKTKHAGQAAPMNGAIIS